MAFHTGNGHNLIQDRLELIDGILEDTSNGCLGCVGILPYISLKSTEAFGEFADLWQGSCSGVGVFDSAKRTGYLPNISVTCLSNSEPPSTPDNASVALPRRSPAPAVASAAAPLAAAVALSVACLAASLSQTSRQHKAAATTVCEDRANHR